MIIDTEATAERLGITKQAVTKAARTGRFGSAAHRGARGEWLFDWPAAKEVFRRKTDPTRYTGAQLDQLAKTEAPAAAPVPALVTPQEAAAIDLQVAEWCASILERARAADLDDDERDQLDQIFACYVERDLPGAAAAWAAGKVVADRDALGARGEVAP